ncbi:MAG TPA: hypothetical protein VFQ38_06195 [Longimicrobiales bacterium]|nr:hypothetical protein [Longimicrobiales bacterium]
MTATVRPATIAGFEALVLENGSLGAAVIPRLGGRVWELVDLARDRQWIWHRPGVPLAASPRGASYDDVWAGGWEELFPNDAPGSFEGCLLPDHGEWWTSSWTVTEASGGAEACVRLEADARMRGARCFKELRLASDRGELRVAYRIENPDAGAFHFLFKQHLPVAIHPGCRLALPGGRVTAVEPAFGTLLPGPGPFDWPRAGERDLRVVPPPSSAAREFVYLTDLPDAWCGVDDLESGASLRLRYDARHLPFVWLFLAYGGWRDCYTAVLEPCTNLPKDLAEAVRRGQSAWLPGRGVFETSVTVTLDGLSGSEA